MEEKIRQILKEKLKLNHNVISRRNEEIESVYIEAYDTCYYDQEITISDESIERVIKNILEEYET